MSGREITGRQVFVVTALAFGVIIAVNVTMAVKAITTFPGLEVKNSYVASQSFDARRLAQEALGWQVETIYDGERLSVAFSDANGAPVWPDTIEALVGRTTSAGEDRAPVFTDEGGTHVARLDLERGSWTLKLKAVAPDGTLFEKRMTLWVR